MVTQIVTKNLVSVGVVEPSELTITIDPVFPEGTEVRVEVWPEKGFIQPRMVTLTADDEVEGELRVFTDSEQTVLYVEPGSSVTADVPSVFGDILAKKIILIARVFFPMTTARAVTLKYSGAIYDFR